MHKFFSEGCLPACLQLKKEDVRHAKTVLRLQPGEKIILTDKKGQSAICQIISLENGLELALQELLSINPEPELEVILGQGLSKGDKMDFVVQKAVELGTKEIWPLALARSVVNYKAEKAGLKNQRWQKIAEQAAKQSQRSLIPVVQPILSLAEALTNVQAGLKLVLYEEEQAQGLKGLLKNNISKVKKVFLLIGPEGGLTKEEVKLCQEAGFISCSLGKRILRTETAAVTGLSLVMYELADLGEINA